MATVTIKDSYGDSISVDGDTSDKLIYVAIHETHFAAVDAAVSLTRKKAKKLRKALRHALATNLPH